MNQTLGSTNNSISTKTFSNVTFSSLSYFEKRLFKASYFIYNNKYGFITSHLTLVLVALSVITYASFASLEAPKNSEVPKHKEKRVVKGNKNKNPESLISDGFVTERYALFLPILCACGLGGMYYAFKYFKPASISYFLNRYVLLISLLAFYQFFSHTFKIIFLRLENRFNLSEFIPRYRITFTEDKYIMDGSDAQTNFEYIDLAGKQPLLEIAPEKFIPPTDIQAESQFLNIYISSIDINAFITAVIFTTLYYLQQDKMNWFFSNLIAWTFAFEGIVRFRLNSFRTAAIILTGLFFYDIYFVFHTDMMVTVAKSIDIPVLLKLPSGANFEKHVVDHSSDFFVPKLPLSMLGLGDIVIPGSVIAFCMRYDLFKYHQLENKPYHYLNSFKLRYFTTAVVSYTVGLILTFIALHVFNTAQPALLYLSPSLLIGISLAGYFNGNLQEILNYDENETKGDESKVESDNTESEEVEIVIEEDFDYNELSDDDYEDEDLDLEEDEDEDEDDLNEDDMFIEIQSHD